MGVLRYVALKYKRNREWLDRTHLNDVGMLKATAMDNFSMADSLKHTNRIESVDLTRKSIRMMQRVKVLLKNSIDDRLELDINLKAVDKEIDGMRHFLLQFCEDEIDSSVSVSYGDKYFDTAKDLFAKADLVKNRRRTDSVKLMYDALKELSRASEYFASDSSSENTIKLDMTEKFRKKIEESLEWFSDAEKNRSKLIDGLR